MAVAFGVSLLTVQRRLKLAAVSPKLLALYREDDKTINLDQLMALAISDDHAAQERAWFESHEWDRSPAALKRKLTAGEVEAAGNALVRFVGVEAYEAAGGIVRRDLFDDEQGRFLSDPELLTRLAGEKLEAIAASVREEGWAWVEARVELDSQALRQFTPCEHTVRKPNADEKAELAELARARPNSSGSRTRSAANGLERPRCRAHRPRRRGHRGTPAGDPGGPQGVAGRDQGPGRCDRHDQSRRGCLDHSRAAARGRPQGARSVAA